MPSFETFAKTELELQLLQEAHDNRTDTHGVLVDLGLAVLRRKAEGGYELLGDASRRIQPTSNTTLVVEVNCTHNIPTFHSIETYHPIP